MRKHTWVKIQEWTPIADAPWSEAVNHCTECGLHVTMRAGPYLVDPGEHYLAPYWRAEAELLSHSPYSQPCGAVANA